MEMLRVAMKYFAPVIREGERINPDWLTELLENIINSVEKSVSVFSNMVLQASLRILTMIYAPIAVVGVILYVTKINKYLGRDLIYGALIIAFFAEFILPILL